MLYGEEMITEQPWPSALGAMRLAYRFLPGVGMDWGQEPVLMAPQESSQGFYSGWEMLQTLSAVGTSDDLAL